MNTTDYAVVNAMRSYGGAFVKALASAAAHADQSNLERLKAAFPEYWEKYAEMVPTTPKETAP